MCQNLPYNRWVVNHFIHATSNNITDNACFDPCAIGFWNNANIAIFFWVSIPSKKIRCGDMVFEVAVFGTIWVLIKIGDLM